MANLRHNVSHLMPVEKSHLQTINTLLSSPSPPPLGEEKDDDSLQSSENHNQEQPENGCDSEGCIYSSDEEKDEFIVVELAEIRKEVQCPICLGIIKKTRTVMECLHRFCRECIDKSMRVGNNECPACRTHCASRRSLRDDPNYDALIAALYPEIMKYEEEELTEAEIAHNKLIQDSIAEAFRRQESNGRKRKSAKGKKRDNYQSMKSQGPYEEEVGHNGRMDWSPVNHSAEVKSKQYKQLGGAGPSQPSSGANAHHSEMKTKLLGSFASLRSTKFFAWGGGGICSNTHHGGSTSNSNQTSIDLLLVTLEEDKLPRLEVPYYSCSPKTTVGYLIKEVAKQTSVGASDIEMLLVKDYRPVYKNSMRQIDAGIVDPSRHEFLLLDEHVTVEEIHKTFYDIDLALGYRLKMQAGGSSLEYEDAAMKFPMFSK